MVEASTSSGRPSPYVFHVLTLFPEMVRQATAYSLLGRAIQAGLCEVRVYDIRDHTHDRHRTVDDEPYGGGPGMVMKVEPVVGCLAKARAEAALGTRAFLMSASGVLFNQAMARSLAADPGVILVCGHYEGVDERVAAHYVDGEVCIGDYVLSGGEVAALVVVETVARLIPGVVGNRESLTEESHEEGLVEYPQYTRPAEFEGHRVPEILLSGNHAEIRRFRREQALAKTRRNRPDLYARLRPDLGETSRVALRLGRPPDPDE